MLTRITILAAAVVLAIPAATAAKGGKLRWYDDPQAAMALAKKSGKGMMLYFTSDG